LEREKVKRSRRCNTWGKCIKQETKTKKGGVKKTGCNGLGDKPLLRTTVPEKTPGVHTWKEGWGGSRKYGRLQTTGTGLHKKGTINGGGGAFLRQENDRGTVGRGKVDKRVPCNL